GGHLHMVELFARRRSVLLMRPVLFLSRRPRIDAAIAAVEARVDAHVRHVYVLDIRVMDHGAVHVHDSGVIGEVAALPASAEEPHAAISEAVVDAAVEADVRSPIALMPDEGASAPAPVTGGPQQANGRRPHPHTGHPVIAGRTVGPVPRRPKIAVAWAEGLRVDRQRGWRKPYRDNDRRVRGRRHDGQCGSDNEIAHCMLREDLHNGRTSVIGSKKSGSAFYSRRANADHHFGPAFLWNTTLRGKFPARRHLRRPKLP